MRSLRTSLVAAAVALVCGCASGNTLRLTGSPQVPAAQGTVFVSRGANNNTLLRIDVHHLAPPERVAPGASALVAWVSSTAAGGSPQNVGALQVNGKLEGELHTITPLQDFDLMITAEPSPTVVSPSGTPLLSTHVNRR